MDDPKPPSSGAVLAKDQTTLVKLLRLDVELAATAVDAVQAASPQNAEAARIEASEAIAKIHRRCTRVEDPQTFREIWAKADALSKRLGKLGG